MATVLYIDIHGFSNLTNKDDSQSIIDDLDEIFLQFDKIVEKYKIEKIKTIGDTYMCAGGIPEKNSTNPIDVVMAALEMQAFMQSLNNNIQLLELRMGIHSGAVTAQISGKKKISYELKGDTVNIASRMEAASKAGEINISVMTYELIKEFFTCAYQGSMPVKYQGNLEMYFVKGLLPELAADDTFIKPNQNFFTKYGLVQFVDLQEIVLDRLEKELPEYLHYHNVKHTVDVVTEVELIGWGEGVNDEEILLLKTAALFHDFGHIIDFDTHEYQGTLLAQEILPKYGYSQEQIDAINNIIMATKLPPKPTTLLQKIICDSDLDYLGRSDMVPVSNTLYDELKAQNKIGSLNDWNKLQVKFISNHQYFTETARNLREVNKQQQIERIKSLITED
jgi:class 3 adenylate cyclase